MDKRTSSFSESPNVGPYRGRGRRKGPWLVVSFCDGVGGMCAVLQSLALEYDALAAEKEGALRRQVHTRVPHVTPVADCKDITVELVMKKFDKHGTEASS